MIDQETAVLICGDDTNLPPSSELTALSGQLRANAAGGVDCATLHDNGAGLRAAVGGLKAAGAGTVVCVPATLFATAPVKNDLPSLINGIAADTSDINLIYASQIGIDPRLLSVARDRVAAVEAGAGDVAREESLLMVIGAGTGDEDADSDLGKVGRLLWEGMGFGWAEVCFAANGFPSIADSFAKAARLGYRRIVVLPYVLFADDAVDSITAQVDAVDSGDAEVLIAGHLGPDAAVAATIVDRVTEALRGDNNMNCQMCTYREQVIAGGNQPGDHHHHHHDHEHGHEHGHHHHHHDDAD